MNKAKFIIFFTFILLMFSVTAENVTIAHGVTFDATQAGENLFRGFIISMNGNYSLVNVTKNTISTCTTAYVINYPNQSSVGNATFVGDVATFLNATQGRLNLTKGQNYFIGCGGNAIGVLYDMRYTTTLMGMPNVFPSAAYNISAYQTLGGIVTTAPTTAGYNIIQIGFTNDTYAVGGGGIGDPLNITTAYPLNGTQYKNGTINFNITYSSSVDVIARLFINGSLNMTVTYPPSVSGAISNISMLLADRDYNFFFNLTSSLMSKNSTVNTFFIDTITPAQTWFYPSLSNNSIHAGSFPIKVTALTATDNNLFSYYFNISTMGGTNLYSLYNTSLTGLSTTNINISLFGLTNYGMVLSTWLQVCDGHTAKTIDFGTIKKSNKQLEFKEVQIVPLDKTDIVKVDSLKKQDRYNFNFELNNEVAIKTFKVTSPDIIYIPEGTGYHGHLITGNKWVDFEIDNLKSTTVNKITDYEVEVTIELSKPTSSWIFNSIGELNCIANHARFLSVNTSETYTPQVITSSTSTFTLNVTYNASFVNSISAVLLYNNTQYVPTATNFSSYYRFSVDILAPDLNTNRNISFQWNYTINGINYEAQLRNQSIFGIDIDNCTIYTTPFINFTLKDEINQSDIVGTVNVLIKFWENTFTGFFNVSSTGSTTYKYCISPAFANFTGNISVLYTSLGYNTREYIQQSVVIDNATDYVNLYNLLTSQSTPITVHVIDDKSNNLQNVLVEAYRFDTDLNANLLVGMETTDQAGKVKFNLKSGTEYYNFKFYQNGVLKKQTGSFKLFDTSYQFIIFDVGTPIFVEKFNLGTGLASYLNYSNVSNIVVFGWTYSGAGVSSFCLNITDFNVSYFGQCSTITTSSQLNFTITQFNKTYYAVGAAISTTGNRYILKTLTINTINSWKVWTKELGLPIAVILFMIITMLFLVNKNIAIIGVFLALAIISFFSLTPLTTVGIIGIVCVGVILLFIMNRRAS